MTDSRQEDLEKALKMLLTAIKHNADEKLEMLDELWYAHEIGVYVGEGYSWDEAGKKFLENV